MPVPSIDPTGIATGVLGTVTGSVGGSVADSAFKAMLRLRNQLFLQESPRVP